MITAAFLGTPAAAVPSLAALAGVADVRLVVTRPDRPKGRSGKPTPPPVKLAAQEWGFPVAQPPTKVGLHQELLRHSLDVAVVVAFGMIVPPDTLGLPDRGFVNVHFSLLPRWRGAAPVERAILGGDDTSGVSLMAMDEGLDTGPVIAAHETPVADYETGGELTARLAALGASVLESTLVSYVRGAVEPAPQLEAGVTIAPRLDRKEARLDRATPVDYFLRSVRAFNPRPGAWVEVDGKPMKVLEAAALSERAPSPGAIEAQGERLLAGLADGGVELLVIQPAGRGRLTGKQWLNGRRGAPATFA